MTTPLKVLLIEDNAVEAELIKEFLSAELGDAIEVTRVDRLAKGLERLQQGDIKAVLLDLMLPDSDGLATLAKVKSQVPLVPIIVMSGLEDSALAEAAMREGAQDFLVKGTVTSKEIVRALHNAVRG
jgi:CheY-like chemotaxis protein